RRTARAGPRSGRRGARRRDGRDAAGVGGRAARTGAARMWPYRRRRQQRRRRIRRAVRHLAFRALARDAGDELARRALRNPRLSAAAAGSRRRSGRQRRVGVGVGLAVRRALRGQQGGARGRIDRDRPRDARERCTGAVGGGRADRRNGVRVAIRSGGRRGRDAVVDGERHPMDRGVDARCFGAEDRRRDRGGARPGGRACCGRSGNVSTCGVPFRGAGRPRTLLLFALGIGLVVRLARVARDPLVHPDGPAYLDLATALARGELMPVLGGYFSPLYPAAVSIVAATGLGLELAGRLTAVLAGVALLPLVYTVARR